MESMEEETKMKTLIITILLTAAAAFAQETAFVIDNHDGTVTIISNRDYNGVPVYVPYVPQGNGGRDRGRCNDGYDWQKYPTWGNRWSPMDGTEPMP